MVRHGERIDEVPDPSIIHNLPRWDPPLTRNGYKQGAEAGVRLQAEHTRLPFDRVLVSPCARTLQTASYLAASLSNIPLQPVPGLAECAAAVQKPGIASFEPTLRSAGKAAFLTPAEATEFLARGARIEPIEPRYDEDFERCVNRLASEACARGLARILIVTHREGIRDLAKLAGVRGRVSTGYCCIATFRFASSANGQAQWTMLTSPTTKALPPLPPLASVPPIAPMAAAAADGGGEGVQTGKPAKGAVNLQAEDKPVQGSELP